MFPHPGVLALVLRKRFHRIDQQAGGAVRPQAQVGLVQQSRRCMPGEPGIDALAELGVNFRGVGVIVIIQKDQIEIGNIPEFFAAQFAIADDRERRRVAVTLFQAIPSQIRYRTKNQIRQRSQMIAQGFQQQRAFQIGHQQAENLGVLEMSQHIHLPFQDVILGAVVMIELIGEIFGKHLPIRRRMWRIMAEQFIEQDRVPA